MELKKCIKCGEEKSPTNDFYPGRNSCKTCKFAYNKQWLLNHPDKALEQDRRFRKKHAVRLVAQQKEYYETNKERLNKANAEYYRTRRKNDPEFRLRVDMSTLIARIFRDGGTKKIGSLMDHLPYSIEDLRSHLESLFEAWMNWGNHGRYSRETWDDNDQSTWTWHIDHIIPRSSFTYSSMEDEQFQQCWALSNLRPLSAKRNHLDGVKRTRHKSLPP